MVVSDSKDKIHSLTLLLWAAKNEYGAVAKMLLAKDGISLNSKDAKYCRKPLSWVAENGQMGVLWL